MHKDYTITTTNKDMEKPIGDEIAGDVFVEVGKMEETKVVSFEEKKR